MAKDALGAAVTLAVIGAFLLQATNRLARPCGAKLNRRWSRVTSTTAATTARLIPRPARSPWIWHRAVSQPCAVAAGPRARSPREMSSWHPRTAPVGNHFTCATMIAACKSPNVFEPPPGKRADPPIGTPRGCSVRGQCWRADQAVRAALARSLLFA